MNFKCRIDIDKSSGKYLLVLENDDSNDEMLLSKEELEIVMKTIAKELNYDIKEHFEPYFDGSKWHWYDEDNKNFLTPIINELTPIRRTLITPKDKLNDDDRKKLDNLIKKSEEINKMIKSSEERLKNEIDNALPSRLFYVEVDTFQKFVDEIKQECKKLDDRMTKLEEKRKSDIKEILKFRDDIKQCLYNLLDMILYSHIADEFKQMQEICNDDYEMMKRLDPDGKLRYDYKKNKWVNKKKDDKIIGPSYNIAEEGQPNCGRIKEGEGEGEYDN